MNCEPPEGRPYSNLDAARRDYWYRAKFGVSPPKSAEEAISNIRKAIALVESAGRSPDSVTLRPDAFAECRRPIEGLIGELRGAADEVEIHDMRASAVMRQAAHVLASIPGLMVDPFSPEPESIAASHGRPPSGDPIW